MNAVIEVTHLCRYSISYLHLLSISPFVIQILASISTRHFNVTEYRVAVIDGFFILLMVLCLWACKFGFAGSILVVTVFGLKDFYVIFPYFLVSAESLVLVCHFNPLKTLKKSIRTKMKTYCLSYIWVTWSYLTEWGRNEIRRRQAAICLTPTLFI